MSPARTFLLSLLPGLAWLATTHAEQATVKPGAPWADDRGRPVQAHGGAILRQGETFYWFGEDHAPGNDPAHRYVSGYSSLDLVHWTHLGQVLNLADPEGLGPKWILERPKVFGNAATGKFVMYMHIDGPMPGLEGDYRLARVGVAIADRMGGPYVYQRSFRPLGMESRDIGQFLDDDGSAYLIFESRPTKGFVIARLSADYLDIAAQVCLVPASLEGGAIVHYQGLYYAIGSALTGWSPNPNVYATAKALAGPWSAFRDIAPRPSNTYGSQSSFLLKITGARTTTVIFMGDIWKPAALGDSRYLWMPVTLGDGEFRLPPPAPWSIDLRSGKATISPAPESP